ncbi:unnamed protein product [Psylliodes chrysocephalus]|uniref:Regulatory protein zeste n=1 Tax=Psylliodes chrysocephalus TaxID=3402493 RepID=A0A9P0G4A4_9CUCU|nr:unnamed protein product [Psylliodes chrysocephala]
MAFKIKEEHMEVLIDFMETHNDFATGRLSTNNAKEKYKLLWTELTIRLNSLGLGERTKEKWQKTWTDYKCNLKKKASEIKNAQEGTGGGPELKKQLSNMEMRVLSLLGNTFYEGCGTPERGLNYIKPNTSVPEEKTNPITKKMKRGDTCESTDNLYKETIRCLNNIETNITSNLKEINNTLSSNLNELNNTLSSKFDELISVLKRKEDN